MALINPIFAVFIFQEPQTPATSVLVVPEQALRDTDIISLVKKLGFADLYNLYKELTLTDEEVEDAQGQAVAPGKLAKAMAVFHKWQQNEGKAATKMALLRALQKCTLIDTMQKMQEEWELSMPE